MPRLALLSAGALAAISLAAATAAAEAPTAEWVRAVGRANNLNVKTPVVTGFGPVCSPACDAVGSVDFTVTMTVDAATQRKYKLPSRTIARSGPFVQRGEGQATDMKATAAMRKKLKLVKQLPVTTTLVVRAPLVETAKKKQTFTIGATGKNRVCVGTALDPLCGPTGNVGR